MEQESCPAGQQDDDEREEHLPDEEVHGARHLDLEEDSPVIRGLAADSLIAHIARVVVHPLASAP